MISQFNKKEKDISWYIIQTYSGQENNVKIDLEKRIKSMNMSEYILQVLVPEEKYIFTSKNGKKKEKIRQIYPGYVFVQMIVNDKSWFIVRNTPRVTSFLGSNKINNKPIPVQDKEIQAILDKKKITQMENLDFLLEKKISILEGTFINQIGEVIKVDNEKKIITVLVDMFGRKVSLELQKHQFAIKTSSL